MIGNVKYEKVIVRGSGIRRVPVMKQAHVQRQFEKAESRLFVRTMYGLRRTFFQQAGTLRYIPQHRSI